jgi:hypothetical protein
MRVELSIEVTSADTGTTSTYNYAAELPDKWGAEMVEAHCSSMFKILDAQATDSSDDDDEDSQKWKQNAP